mmetsp:Transcript_4742/g.10280  ORF Transcript_4742/g.10280 Transcript_4742/m.10280 type:complete len:85 (-) Transcript_4742:774-1028(-)
MKHMLPAVCSREIDQFQKGIFTEPAIEEQRRSIQVSVAAGSVLFSNRTYQQALLLTSSWSMLATEITHSSPASEIATCVRVLPD